MSNTLKVGILDSGIGGISVLSKILEKGPFLNIYYYADQRNAPYGLKSSEFIEKRCFEITEEFLAEGVEVIVLACNTATGQAISKLRESYEIPFIGIEPFLNVIHKDQINCQKERVGILTTVSTGESRKFQELKERLDPSNLVDHLPSSELASLIETEYSIQEAIAGISSYSSEFRGKIEAELGQLNASQYRHLILGCTHYPLIAPLISEISGAQVHDPSEAVATRLFDVMQYQRTENSADGPIHIKSSLDNNGFRRL